jgi:DNA uptake protein ComE-like DNA-binding protein
LRAATPQQIASVPGIGEKMAQSIFEQLISRQSSVKVDAETGEILDA